MDRNNVFIESLYGYKYTYRNIIFRIFAFLAIIGLAIFQYTPLSQINDYDSINDWFRYPMDWTSIALPSSIAFKSAYYFNIIQLIFIIGFIPNDLKTSKWKAMDVFHARPQSNSEIVTGNFIGKLLVFVMINCLWFLFSIIINIAFYPGSFKLSYYFFYLITLTFPSLVYFLGLSYLVTRFIHNQGLCAIVLFLLLGGISIWGGEIFNGLLDPYAREFPNMFSDFIGHVGLRNYLLQRSCILLTGIICLSLSIIYYPRIPNNKATARNCLFIVGILFSVVGGMMLFYHSEYKTTDTSRKLFVQVYEDCRDCPKAKITKHNLHVKNSTNNSISVHSQMNLVNRNACPIPIILFLNPGLKINSVEINGEPVNFRRTQQVIFLNKELIAGETCNISIDYEGKIDNNICFLDVSPERYHPTDANNYGIYHFGYMPTFCEKEYKLLTPECLWYPVCDAPYSLFGCRNVCFTRYSLKVEHDPHLVAISQGEINENVPGETSFILDHDIPGITLCIGKYEKRVLMIDSTRLQFYYFPGHEHIVDKYDLQEEELQGKLSFTKMRLEMQECIKAGKYTSNFFENRSIVDPVHQYPYRWLTLLEVPCNFYSFPSLTQLTGEREQGGIFFIPEKIYPLKEYACQIRTDIEGYGSIDCLDSDFEMLMGEGGCDIKPVLRGKTSFIFSKEYPIINNVLGYISSEGFSQRSFSNKDYHIIEYLKNKSLKDALNDHSLTYDDVKNIIRKKSIELQMRIILHIRKKELFDQFYSDFLSENLFKETNWDEFCKQFQQTLHVNLDSLVRNWYYTDQLPLFEIKDARMIKVHQEENAPSDILYSFKVFNKSDVSGIIITGDYQKWIIPPHEGKEIRTYCQSEYAPDYIGMPLAQNLPGTIQMKTENIENVHIDTGTGIFDLDSSAFFQGENIHEIIVDNEDLGFRVVKAEDFHISSLFRKEKSISEKYQDFFREDKWQPTINEGFYGFPIRSALYKLAGSGLQKVEWNVQLPRAGEYEVYFYYAPLFNMDPKLEFHYTVFDGKKEHEVIAEVNKGEEGWISLGIFEFSKNAKVILSDRDRKNNPNGTPQELIADAIKWVKL